MNSGAAVSLEGEYYTNTKLVDISITSFPNMENFINNFNIKEAMEIVLAELGSHVLYKPEMSTETIARFRYNYIDFNNNL